MVRSWWAIKDFVLHYLFCDGSLQAINIPTEKGLEYGGKIPPLKRGSQHSNIQWQRITTLLIVVTRHSKCTSEEVVVLQGEVVFILYIYIYMKLSFLLVVGWSNTIVFGMLRYTLFISSHKKLILNQAKCTITCNFFYSQRCRRHIYLSLTVSIKWTRCCVYLGVDVLGVCKVFLYVLGMCE